MITEWIQIRSDEPDYLMEAYLDRARERARGDKLFFVLPFEKTIFPDSLPCRNRLLHVLEMIENLLCSILYLEYKAY